MSITYDVSKQKGSSRWYPPQDRDSQGARWPTGR